MAAKPFYHRRDGMRREEYGKLTGVRCVRKFRKSGANQVELLRIFHLVIRVTLESA